MARILIVTSEFTPFQSSGINRLSFFKNFLESEGHDVFILTTNAEAQGLQSKNNDDTQSNILRAYSLNLLTRRILSSRRFPIYPRIAKTGKYAVWIPFAVKKGIKIIKNKEIDLVLTSFPDFSSIEVAEKIARTTNTTLITDFRDPPYWIYDNPSLSKKVLHCQEIVKKSIETSAQIITCTDESSHSLKEYYKVNTNFTVINNGYDLDVIKQVTTTNIIKNKDIFEIIHIGSFYNEGRDVKPVITALVAQSKNKNIHLRLIGDEPDMATQQYIQQVAQAITVTIEAPVLMIEALSIAKSADALLLLQGSRFDRQIPTKVYEYLALNTPIWAVVGTKGATQELLQSYSSNVVFSDYDNQDSITQGVNDLISFKASEINTVKLSRQYQATRLLTLINEET